MNSISSFFQEFNYGQYLLSQIFNSSLIKNKLTDILLAISANLFEMQSVAFVSYLLTTNTPLDYITPIAVSVTFAIHINIFYQTLQPLRPQFYKLSKYLIHNYTFENYIYWKRLVVTCITIYAFILLSLIQINNTYILIYIGQTFVGFIILDQYEQKYFHKIIQNYQEKPTVLLHQNLPPQKDLLLSYFPNKNNNHYLSNDPKIIWLRPNEDEERRDNSNIILRNSLRRSKLEESFLENKQSLSCSF